MDCDHTVGDKSEVSGRDFRLARLAEGDAPSCWGRENLLSNAVALLDSKLLKSVEKHRRASLKISKLQVEMDVLKKERAALGHIWTALWEQFIDEPWDEQFQEFGEKAGLLQRVPYDPEKHGDVDTEPGDLIYVLTDLGEACLVAQPQ